MTVAVIDSGVSPDPPQLRGAVLPGTDVFDHRGPGAEDCTGHGTLVAGIIAARLREGTPFQGIAPEATILPVRVLPTVGSALPAEGAVAEAIRYAVHHGANVINLSLTTGTHDGAVRAAVEEARRANVVMVAAADNTTGAGTNDPRFPAAYPGVLAVGGVDQSGMPVRDSGRGGYVDLAAPGYEIAGPAPRGGGYLLTHDDGTSFAAAYVSATAALVRSYLPSLPADQVADRILRTSDHPPSGRDDAVGYGVVNPYLAVTAVLPDRAGNTAVTPPAGPALPEVSRSPDPLAVTRAAALGILGGVVVLLGLGGAGRTVIARGRRRAWRPGGSAADHGPAPH